MALTPHISMSPVSQAMPSISRLENCMSAAQSAAEQQVAAAGPHIEGVDLMPVFEACSHTQAV